MCLFGNELENLQTLIVVYLLKFKMSLMTTQKESFFVSLGEFLNRFLLKSKIVLTSDDEIENLNKLLDKYFSMLNYCLIDISTNTNLKFAKKLKLQNYI